VRTNGVKGCDLNVANILGIPNAETPYTKPYNDGFEPTNNISTDSLTDDEFVRLIQTYLNDKHGANLVVDGICGTKTRAAVKKYIGA
jgi:hypothetical protein